MIIGTPLMYLSTGGKTEKTTPSSNRFLIQADI